MKAIVMTKFGPPDMLRLQEVAKPVPKDKARPSLLVKITNGDRNDTISTDIEGENNHDEKLPHGSRDRCFAWYWTFYC